MTSEMKAREAPDPLPNIAQEDPLVRYLEYVVDEVEGRSDLAAYLLRMAIEELYDGPSRLTTTPQ